MDGLGTWTYQGTILFLPQSSQKVVILQIQEKTFILGKKIKVGVRGMVQLKHLPDRICSKTTCGKLTRSYVVIREARTGIVEVVVCDECFKERISRKRRV
mgnify:CR=1 FL=1